MFPVTNMRCRRIRFRFTSASSVDETTRASLGNGRRRVYTQYWVFCDGGRERKRALPDLLWVNSSVRSGLFIAVRFCRRSSSARSDSCHRPLLAELKEIYERPAINRPLLAELARN